MPENIMIAAIRVLFIIRLFIQGMFGTQRSEVSIPKVCINIGWTKYGILNSLPFKLIICNFAV
jgi:hypothetical protein